LCYAVPRRKERRWSNANHHPESARVDQEGDGAALVQAQGSPGGPGHPAANPHRSWDHDPRPRFGSRALALHDHGVRGGGLGLPVVEARQAWA
jgi:hypothetical protein